MSRNTGLSIVAVLGVVAALVFWKVSSKASHDSRAALMQRADELSWNNRWIEATPLYARAEGAYSGDPARALYAHVSQFIVRADSEPAQPLLLELARDLSSPAASDPETRLRILVVKGMIETNYDASMARSTWRSVEGLARDKRHYLLMARAMGEQGIAAFLLGDFTTAKGMVMRAWLAAKYLGDDAAHVRYASLYGAGLVELQRYPDAIKALDEAIDTAGKSKDVAYPSIAINSKIDALRGLHQYDAALDLADQAIQRLPSNHLDAHLYQILTSKGEVYQDKGDWQHAISEYATALNYARHLEYWRGIVQTGGLEAQAYLHERRLVEALQSIDEALRANEAIPQELYFSPRNLAIKAEILDRLGRTSEARLLHEESLGLLDSLLATAPTPNVERELLTELRTLYSDYFSDLCQRGRYPEAFAVIEKARGRIETRALLPRPVATVDPPPLRDSRMADLDISLVKSEDPTIAAKLKRAVEESTESDAGPTLNRRVAVHPVSLEEVQQHLDPSELILEFVLDEPRSSVLAITSTSVTWHLLGSGKDIEAHASLYRREVHAKKTDSLLSRNLFMEVLGSIPEYRQKTNLIVVPDGQLHLLPFAALTDNGQFVLVSHTVTVAPSASVLVLLRERAKTRRTAQMAYIGIGAPNPGQQNGWIPAALTRRRGTPFSDAPQTEEEVKAIASYFPGKATVLVGEDATESRFRALPLDRYRILHLALHGYANVEASDRSALLFAPEANNANDGILRLSEIQELHLAANLVTLSACDTGVGPLSEVDVDNLGNAFLEAGAQSVVTSLWDLEDLTTERMMNAFYKNLSEGQSKPRSLQGAQLEIMRAGLPPYYWASTELLGDPAGSI